MVSNKKNKVYLVIKFCYHLFTTLLPDLRTMKCTSPCFLGVLLYALPYEQYSCKNSCQPIFNDFENALNLRVNVAHKYIASIFWSGKCSCIATTRVFGKHPSKNLHYKLGYQHIIVTRTYCSK